MSKPSSIPDSSRQATAKRKERLVMTPEQRRKRVGRKGLKAVRSWCKS